MMRLYGNALSLINVMTLHHRGLLAFPWNRMEHVCLEDFGRLRQLLSLSLTIWSCIALQLFIYFFIFVLGLFDASIKQELSELTHHFPLQFQIPFWTSTHTSFVFSFSRLLEFNLQATCDSSIFIFPLDILL